MDYLIGIDTGTTNTKVVCFDTEGHAVAFATTPTQLVMNADGLQVYPADTLFSTICSLLKNTLKQLSQTDSRFHICGLAVSGMGEAGIPLDANDHPLYDIIPWFDPCTASYEEKWAELLGLEELESVTGLRFQHIFTANKLLWLKENKQELYARIKRWHCIPDYIAYCLTGVSCMDFSLASRTMMLDFHTKTWSDKILSILSLPSSALPTLVESGEPVGRVTEKAASATGLPEGTPIYAGGHDHICGAFAIGVRSERVAMDSMGTSEELLIASSNPEHVLVCGQKGFNVGLHTVKEQFYVAGGIPASGLSVDWCRQTFCSGSYQGSVPGANGILCFPFLRGTSSPDRNPNITASFLGARDSSRSADFMQAVYDGLGYEALHILSSICDMSDLKRIICIGGSTRNNAFMQAKVDIYNCTLEIPENSESVALGAALLAGRGSGIYKDEKEMHERTYRISQTVFPDEKRALLYHDLYQEYLTTYTHLYNQ